MATIVRQQKEINYSVVDNKYINDHRLSWKAVGIMTYILSKPDQWEIKTSDIENNGKDGRDSIQSGLRELRRYGYLVYTRSRALGGKFEHTYEAIERPDPNIDLGSSLVGLDDVQPQTENPPMVGEIDPEVAFPTTEKPTTENPPIIVSTEQVNTDTLKEGQSSQLSMAEVLGIPKQETKKPIGLKDITQTFANERPQLSSSIFRYFRGRVKRKLSVEQWQIILGDINKYYPDDLHAVEMIDNANANNFQTVVPNWVKEKGVPMQSRSQSDNTSPNSFTPNVGGKVEVARDQQGNAIKF